MVTKLGILGGFPGSMSKPQTFGYWLRIKRKALDLTRERLAEHVGCSAALIRKLESEERRPSKQIVTHLANFFSIPQSEQNQFLRFARGDWHTAPAEREGEALWGTSSLSSRANLPAHLTSLNGRARQESLSEPHTFGHWLRLKRKRLDLTREELAEKVGCSAALIRKLETEERRPSEQIVARLA